MKTKKSSLSFRNAKINILKQKTERNNIKTFSEHIFYQNPYIFDYFSVSLAL